MALAIPVKPDHLLKAHWADTSRASNELGTGSSSQERDFAGYYSEGIKRRQPSHLSTMDTQAGSAVDTQVEIDDGNIDAVRAATELVAADKVYKRLSALYARMGSPRGRAARQRVWRRYPEIARAVLLSKGRRDEDVERLAEVAASLADVEVCGVGRERALLLDEFRRLASDATAAFTEAFLQALRWADEPLAPIEQKRLFELLVSQSDAADPDVRQSVAETAILLPPDDATRFLESLRDKETDEDVIDAIEEIRAAVEG